MSELFLPPAAVEFFVLFYPVSNERFISALYDLDRSNCTGYFLPPPTCAAVCCLSLKKYNVEGCSVAVTRPPEMLFVIDSTKRLSAIYAQRIASKMAEIHYFVICPAKSPGILFRPFGETQVIPSLVPFQSAYFDNPWSTFVSAAMIAPAGAAAPSCGGVVDEGRSQE